MTNSRRMRWRCMRVARMRRRAAEHRPASNNPWYRRPVPPDARPRRPRDRDSTGHGTIAFRDVIGGPFVAGRPQRDCYMTQLQHFAKKGPFRKDDEQKAYESGYQKGHGNSRDHRARISGSTASPHAPHRRTGKRFSVYWTVSRAAVIRWSEHQLQRELRLARCPGPDQAADG